MVAKWEDGAKVVQGVKTKSRENPVLFFLRTVYYWLMLRLFGVPLVNHATDFELIDVSILRILRTVKLNRPFLRGLLSQYAPGKTEYIHYTQEKRAMGRSKFNLGRYYDFAICGIVDQSAKLPRKLLLLSIVCFLLLFVESVCFFCGHIGSLSRIELETAVLIRLFGACILFGQGTASLMFEYVIGIKNGIDTKPFVVEEKRINYSPLEESEEE